MVSKIENESKAEKKSILQRVLREYKLKNNVTQDEPEL